MSEQNRYVPEEAYKPSEGGQQEMDAPGINAYRQVNSATGIDEVVLEVKTDKAGWYETPLGEIGLKLTTGANGNPRADLNCYYAPELTKGGTRRGKYVRHVNLDEEGIGRQQLRPVEGRKQWLVVDIGKRILP